MRVVLRLLKARQPQEDVLQGRLADDVVDNVVMRLARLLHDDVERRPRDRLVGHVILQFLVALAGYRGRQQVAVQVRLQLVRVGVVVRALQLVAT